MDLTPYISTLRGDLTTAASAGDEQTQRTAAVLSAALEPAARLALMNAMSDLAAEITAALGDRVVEVRLDGRDVQVVVTGTGHADDAEPEAGNEPPPPPPAADGGDISRITLRLLDELKAQAERAASSRGVSLNTFVTQALQGALHERGFRYARGGWQGPWGPGGPWPGSSGGRGDEGGNEPRGGRGNSRIRGWVQG
jgi:uncharacterized protein (DUF1778 family)